MKTSFTAIAMLCWAVGTMAYSGECTAPKAHEGDGCSSGNACGINNKNWVVSVLCEMSRAQYSC